MSLSKSELITLANEVKIGPALLDTVFKVESSGNGFNLITGKPIIQFEPHIMARELTKRGKLVSLTQLIVAGKKKWKLAMTEGAKVLTFENGVEAQEAEWVAFNQAWKMSPECAMLSTSWGLMQVMGFNYKAAGFTSVNLMVDAMKGSEYQQAKAGVSFIKSNPALHKALLNKDWATFARLYNGSNYAVNKYDLKLANAYRVSHMHYEYV